MWWRGRMQHSAASPPWKPQPELSWSSTHTGSSSSPKSPNWPGGRKLLLYFILLPMCTQGLALVVGTPHWPFLNPNYWKLTTTSMNCWTFPNRKTSSANVCRKFLHSSLMTVPSRGRREKHPYEHCIFGSSTSGGETAVTEEWCYFW